MRNTFYKNLYVLLLLLSFVACGKKEEDAQPIQATNERVTMDNYNLVTLNMSYTQVVNILGKESKVSASTYSWSADETNTIVINIVFSNNVVQSKTQTGLYVSSGGSSSGSGSNGSTGSSTGGSSAGGCPATYNGRTVYTGPRGGCYYINSKGNKVYI